MSGRSDATAGALQPQPGIGLLELYDAALPQVHGSQVARDFYGAVLGWTYSSGTASDGWSVDGTAPAVGIGGGQARPEVQLCHRVPDVARALRAVRAGGGSAQEPQDKPYGQLAECTDPMGLRFQLWQPPAG